MYFVLHSGQKRTPLHIMNGQAIHETCKSKFNFKFNLILW